MNQLDGLTDQTVKNIEKYEKRWHIFKAILYVVVGAAIVWVNIYTYSHIIDDSNRNRNLLKCALVAFTPSSPSQYSNVSNKVHKCVQNN